MKHDRSRSRNESTRRWQASLLAPTTSSHQPDRATCGERDERPPFVPRIHTRDIFHQLIADELRNGRLTTARRKRIVRYAAQLGLSAVEAGRLITQCREQAIQSTNPVERYHALKLVEPDPECVPVAVKLAAVTLLALIVDLLLVVWPW